MTIPTRVHNLAFDRAVIFEAVDCYPLISDNSEELRKLFDSRSELVKVYINDPIKTADSIVKLIKSLPMKNIPEVYLDISTFTHEILLILLKQFYKSMKDSCRLIYLYNGASEYSVGASDEDKWLSKGCKEVRSVIGYPGRILPGRKTCLIVVVGFEHERATKLIIEMDPEFLVLGKAIISEEDIVDVKHITPMIFFHKLVKAMTSIRCDVRDFEFSCKNPYRTYEKLKELIEIYSTYNCIIAPLNTKISTVAISWIAYKNPAIQICYAVPETYNFANYSIPSDRFTIFPCMD
jgi:hypothetical protein